MQKPVVQEERTLSKYDILSVLCFALFLVLLPISVTNLKFWLEKTKQETAAETETAKQKQPKKVKTEFILFHYQSTEEYE
jgi:hypothetical protein